LSKKYPKEEETAVNSLPCPLNLSQGNFCVTAFTDPMSQFTPIKRQQAAHMRGEDFHNEKSASKKYTNKFPANNQSEPNPQNPQFSKSSNLF